MNAKPKVTLLLPSPHGDSLLIEPKRTKVYFKIKCDLEPYHKYLVGKYIKGVSDYKLIKNDSFSGFSVSVSKWKLRELFMFSDAKTIPAIRKCPKKLGMRFKK